MITNIQGLARNISMPMPGKILSSLTNTQIKIALAAAAIFVILACIALKVFFFSKKPNATVQQSSGTGRLENPPPPNSTVQEKPKIAFEQGTENPLTVVTTGQPVNQAPAKEEKKSAPSEQKAAGQNEKKEEGKKPFSFFSLSGLEDDSSKKEIQQPKIAFNIINGSFFTQRIEELLKAFFDKKNIEGNYDRLEDVIDKFISGNYETKIGFEFQPNIEDCSDSDQSEFRRTGCIAYQEKDQKTGLIKTNIAIGMKFITNFENVKDLKIQLRNHLTNIGRELKRAIEFEKGLAKPEKIVENVTKTPIPEKESVDIKPSQMTAPSQPPKFDESQFPSFELDGETKADLSKYKELFQLVYDEIFVKSLDLRKLEPQQLQIIQTFIQHNQTSNKIKVRWDNFDNTYNGSKEYISFDTIYATILISPLFVGNFLDYKKSGSTDKLRLLFLSLCKVIDQANGT